MFSNKRQNTNYVDEIDKRQKIEAIEVSEANDNGITYLDVECTQEDLDRFFSEQFGKDTTDAPMHSAGNSFNAKKNERDLDKIYAFEITLNQDPRPSGTTQMSLNKKEFPNIQNWGKNKECVKLKVIPNKKLENGDYDYEIGYLIAFGEAIAKSSLNYEIKEIKLYRNDMLFLSFDKQGHPNIKIDLLKQSPKKVKEIVIQIIDKDMPKKTLETARDYFNNRNLQTTMNRTILTIEDSYGFSIFENAYKLGKIMDHFKAFLKKKNALEKVSIAYEFNNSNKELEISNNNSSNHAFDDQSRINADAIGEGVDGAQLQGCDDPFCIPVAYQSINPFNLFGNPLNNTDMPNVDNEYQEYKPSKH